MLVFLLCSNHHDLPVCNTISPRGADSAPQIDAATEEWNKLSFSAAHQNDSILLTLVKLILPGCQIWKWWRGRVWVRKKKSWRNGTDMRRRRKKEGVIFRCLLDSHNITQQTTSIHKRTVFYPLNSRWDENVPPDNRKLKFLHFCGCLVQQDWEENYIRVCSAVENLNREPTRRDLGEKFLQRSQYIDES